MSRKSLILHHIWNTPGVSRKEIATMHRLHPNLVSDTVRELLEAEWIAESGPISGSAGRAPIALQVHPEKRAAVAVTYNTQEITCALVNAAGDMLCEHTLVVSLDTPEVLLDEISRMLRKLLAGYEGHVIGIGVADPGMVDSARGEVVRSTSFPEWRHVRLAEMLESVVGMPVLLQDVTQARAIAHYRSLPELRAAKATMLYLDYGEGIGFALVTPEGAWQGEGFAGELGHVVIEPGGRLCRCGAIGCLETLAAPLALEARAEQLLEGGITSLLQQRTPPEIGTIFGAALEGDRLARSILDAGIGYLGIAVSYLVAAFHPRCLVVGAASEAATRYLTSSLVDIMHDRTPPEIAASVAVMPGNGSRALAIRGAGLMVFDQRVKCIS